jgi:hypothetical protein
VNDPILTTGAEMLIRDISDGCAVHRNTHGAPCIVIPRYGCSAPRTKGQVADTFVGELLRCELISEQYALTTLGTDYCQRHFKR